MSHVYVLSLIVFSAAPEIVSQQQARGDEARDRYKASQVQIEFGHRTSSSERCDGQDTRSGAVSSDWIGSQAHVLSSYLVRVTV